MADKPRTAPARLADLETAVADLEAAVSELRERLDEIRPPGPAQRDPASTTAAATERRHTADLPARVFRYGFSPPQASDG